MRRLLPMILIVGASTGFALASEQPSQDPKLATIEVLLPKKSGAEICLAVNLPRGIKMAIEDWSTRAVTFVPIPGRFEKNGAPVTRPVPKISPEEKVTAVTMLLAAGDLTSSEPYHFILSVRAAGKRKAINASGNCTFFTPEKPGASNLPAAAARKLGCYVECDGGSIGVARAGRLTAIDVSFDREQGLRMGAGCDENAQFRVKAAAEEQAFRLLQVNTRYCRPLKDWFKRHQ